MYTEERMTSQGAGAGGSLESIDPLKLLWSHLASGVGAMDIAPLVDLRFPQAFRVVNISRQADGLDNDIFLQFSTSDRLA